MSPELMTVARPYAKAVFDFAVENQAISYWHDMLILYNKVIKNKWINKLVSSLIAPDKISEIFILACGIELDINSQNLIRTMAEKKRLLVLPCVLEHFIFLRAAYEAIAEIDVVSVSVLNDEQLKKISTAMEYRLSRKVKLNCKVDKSILSGIIIRSGDMVIDGSVLSRLKLLSEKLLS